MSLVVDASVAIKWFVEEVRSDAARAVLDSGEPLIAPGLVVPEVCNAAFPCFYIALAEVESATLVTDDDRVLALARTAGLRRLAQPLSRFAARRR